MKQSISVDQYKSLSPTAKLKWKAWCVEKGYGTAFAADDFVEDAQPTIGILLEFIDEHADLSIDAQLHIDDEYYDLKALLWSRKKEPIDVLFERWKEVLETD